MLMRDAFAAAHEVFALPLDAKRELSITRHGHNRGYVGLGVEALDEKTLPDLKEAYNLTWNGDTTRPPNVWPALPDWRERAQLYCQRRCGKNIPQSMSLCVDEVIQ